MLGVEMSHSVLLSRLKLRHLSLLQGIKRWGTLTRVAIEMGISQPAVTKALSEAEDICGGMLFVRTGRGLVATRLGELAIAKAELILQELEVWGAQIQAVQHGYADRLRIGAMPYVSVELLTQAVQLLYSRHGIASSITQLTSNFLVQALTKRELDCVIGRATALTGLEGVSYEILYEQQVALIAHQQVVRRLQHRQISLADFVDMQWILPSEQTPVGRKIAEMFHKANLTLPVPVVETYDPGIILRMLRHNERLLAIVPLDLAHDLERRGGAGIVPLAFDWNLPAISLIRRTDSKLPSSEELFAQILRELSAAQIWSV